MKEDNFLKQEEIWQKIKEELEHQIDFPAYESWIRPLVFISLDEKKLTLATKNKYSKDWIMKNYSSLIKDIAQDILNKNIEIEIVIKEIIEEVSNATDIEEDKSNIPLNEFQIDSLKSLSNNLNLKFTFDSFVVGSNNKFAHAAAYSSAQSPAKKHNPLFIYGGVGLGKTHLMQAIGHYVLAHFPSYRIKYATTEMFTNDLINSLRKNNMNAFRQKYRQIDLLLLDDIQFIEGKETTQEEIFNTFEALYLDGKQIVITSDRHPKKISTLTERLRSRFEWGLLVDIQVPDVETRIAILKNKVERENMNVPDDVLEVVARAYQNNVRELEGALNRVVAYVSINDCPMTVDSVKNILNFSGAVSTLTLDKIISETASYFSLESADIKGQSRSKEVSQARQVAIYLSRDMTNSSFPTIGNAFGGRKHTTILYAFEKMKEELQYNQLLAGAVSQISKSITNKYM